MTALSFEVVEARAEPYAAVPTIVLRLRISEATGATVHALALRCQIRIEPQRRRYDAAEEGRLFEMFGETNRWGESLRPFLWTHVGTTVTGFTGSTEVDLPITCTYDLEVSGTKYFHALDAGLIPLLLLFAGTAFTRSDTGFAAEPIALARGGVVRAPGAGVARRDGPVLPEQRLDPVESRDDRRADPVQGRTRAADVGAGLRAPPQGSGAGVSAAVDRWADARLVADAVLYEGYVLYPYRASATKNQMRWQFGVLVPPARSEVDRSERSTMRTQCVVDPGATPELTVRVRFLQVQRRTVERSEGCANGSGPRFVDTDALDVDGTAWVAWDEAVEHDVDVAPFLLLPLATARREAKFHVPSGEDVELVHGVGGVVVGRVVRRRTAIGGVVRASAEWAAGPGALLKVTVTVDNVTAWDGAGDTADEARAARDDVVRHSLVAVHTMLALGRRRVRLAPRSSRARRGGGRRVRERRDVSGARRCGGHHRSRCSRRRSSCTTTQRSHRRARATCTTPRRSTRSSRCGSSR